MFKRNENKKNNADTARTTLNASVEINHELTLQYLFRPEFGSIFDF